MASRSLFAANDADDPLSKALQPSPEQSSDERARRIQQRKEAQAISHRVDEGIRERRKAFERWKTASKILLLGAHPRSLFVVRAADPSCCRTGRVLQKYNAEARTLCGYMRTHVHCRIANFNLAFGGLDHALESHLKSAAREDDADSLPQQTRCAPSRCLFLPLRCACVTLQGAPMGLKEVPSWTCADVWLCVSPISSRTISMIATRCNVDDMSHHLQITALPHRAPLCTALDVQMDIVSPPGSE